MKEIDFIPQWYKAGKKRRVIYRRQYFVITGLITAMALWTYAARTAIAKNQNRINEMQAKVTECFNISAEYTKYKDQVAQLKEDAKLLAALDHKINFANVLAEISFLTGDNLVLKEVEIYGEKYAACFDKDNRPALKVATIAGKSSKNALPDTDIVFKVSIKGIAPDVNGVASLISALEESEYFDHVIPSYSKNQKVKDYQVTEFEISCVIINYDVKP